LGIHDELLLESIFLILSILDPDRVIGASEFQLLYLIGFVFNFLLRAFNHHLEQLHVIEHDCLPFLANLNGIRIVDEVRQVRLFFILFFKRLHEPDRQAGICTLRMHGKQHVVHTFLVAEAPLNTVLLNIGNPAFQRVLRTHHHGVHLRRDRQRRLRLKEVEAAVGLVLDQRGEVALQRLVAELLV
jgi:hypothetical protein